MSKTKSGFTIVELLIVIVIIGILAAITVVAYNGMQVRARDTLRTDSIKKIRNALEVYKTTNGRYPAATANPGSGGWELSTDVEGTFLETLKSEGYFSTVPLDPMNNSTYSFWYHRYSPGTYGCPVERGGFYVLRASAYESLANKPKDGSGVTCPTGSQNDPGPTHPMYLHASFEN